MKLRLLSVLILFISFNSLGQTLLPYACVSDQFTADGWMKQYDRKLDSNGIVTQKKQYHPLSIAAYGIMSFDEYNRTGDKRHYQNAINQFKYFNDTNFVHTSNDNTEIGLPYKFNFHDLKAPWYSGMTQGMAISYLLRYYTLTGDETALDIAVKLKNFMVKLAEDGGTVTCTDEGFFFIEEYPNSKNTKEVLNGNINGLIGLYEYLQFFPDDEEAQLIYEENYMAIEHSFEHYDKNEWTSYNRNGKSISNQYIRYQLAELDHLNSFYPNDRFIRQMMLWGYYSYNKFDNNLKFYKTSKYNFSVPLKDSLLNNEIVSITENQLKILPVKIKQNDLLLDSLYVTKKKVELDGTDSFTKVVVRKKGIKSRDIKYIGLPNDKYEIQYFKDELHIQIKDTSLVRISLAFKKKLKGNNQPTIQLSKENRHSAPMFAFKKLGNFKIEKDTPYSLQLESVNTKNLVVFYRIAKDENSLKNTKWKEYHFMNNGVYEFIQSGEIELLVSFQISSGYSQISNVSFNKQVH